MVQWVKKSDRYEPTFNDAAIEWSSYYETSLEACRVRKPRDKGVVEGIVNKFYQYIYAAIRDEEFHTLDELNNRIFELTDQFNDRPSRTTGKAAGWFLKIRSGTVCGNFLMYPSAFATVRRSSSRAIIM